MSAQKATTKSRKSTTTARGKTVRLTAEERDAMKAYLKEQKAAAQGADMLRELLDRIAEMPAKDRSMAKRIHEIVTTAAPSLEPRTWYGMPAYAKDGKVICFFQSAEKFKARYATFEQMQAGDAEIVQEPTEQPYGIRDCAVRDPSGNLIRIQELR